MKNIFKLGSLIVAGLFYLSACNKVDDLKVYGNGGPVTLTSSVNTLAPQATDSNSNVIAFSWTDPKYAQDPSLYKFVIEIDSVGKNFSNPFRKTVYGVFSDTMIGKELNTGLLGLGFAYNTPYVVDVRVLSSYGNNNELYPSSNTIQLNVTPYKIPPKVALPTTNRLFITGGATEFDWTNPDPMPSVRELSRLDETTWGGIFNLNGGSAYLLLRQAGNWDDKYSVQDNSLPGAANAGDFGFRLPQDFPGNVAQGAGWYKMIYDFQMGKYTVTPFGHELKRQLFITGDATPSSWTNSPPASQEFTMISNGLFEITMAFVPGKLYKFLDTNGQWQPQFGGDSPTGGDLGANYGGGSDPAAIPTPDVAGNYKIQVNFVTGKYTVTRL